jgi:hypothetical protein
LKLVRPIGIHPKNAHVEMYEKVSFCGVVKLPPLNI